MVRVQRLKNGEWFTNRVSVCGLFATACPLFATDATTTQELCGGLFRELCRDDTPMVRRAAAANIGPLADAVDARTVQQVRATFATVCNLLADPSSHSLLPRPTQWCRLLCVEMLLAVSKTRAVSRRVACMVVWSVIDPLGPPVRRDRPHTVGMSGCPWSLRNH